ncbi:MAG TPA: dephospho-CoA kinase, partial [Petrotogaceae bacterium]|nr:dephospho-CoA kinase [Petrotogaceae bacterium]
MIIGITGFAGSGKSYVSKIMKEKAESALMKKVLVIDADRVGHDVLSLFFIRQELVKAFGNDILNENGEIDRKALG